MKNLLPSNTAVAMNKVGAMIVSAPASVCDVSGDFTISKYFNAKATKDDYTNIIFKENGVAFQVYDAGDIVRVRFGNAAGDGYQQIGDSLSVQISTFTAIKNKNTLVTIVKKGLVVTVFYKHSYENNRFNRTNRKQC